MSQVVVDGVVHSITHDQYCEIGKLAQKKSTEKKPCTLEQAAVEYLGLGKAKKKLAKKE